MFVCYLDLHSVTFWVDFQDKGIYNQKVNTELLY